MGVPAVALYMKDSTIKVREKLRQMEEQEVKQTAIQSENFTSTVSHEMRTPISTMLFFLQMLLKILQAEPFNLNELPHSITCCKIMV